MTNEKLTQQDALTAPVASDIVHVVDDPGGTPVSKKSTIQNVVGYVVTTAGDLLYATASRTLARLGIGTANQYLRTNAGATAPEWGTLDISHDTSPTAGGDLVGGHNTIYNFEGELNAQTGTTYTLVTGDNGKVVTCNNAAAITVTVPNSLPAGWNCLVIQKGAGQVTFSAAASGNLRNYNSHTKTAGQYAVVSVFIESNAGTAPEIYLGGTTA